MPFYLAIDVNWTIATRDTPADLTQYFSTRKAQGFNAVRMMLIVSHYLVDNGVGANEPANLNGDVPFTSEVDFSTVTSPTGGYFSNVTDILDLALANDFVVLFNYTYWGNGGGPQGWWPELGRSEQANPVCTNWGTFIGNLIAPYPNIILEPFGDYNPGTTSSETTRSIQILTAIRAICPSLIAEAEMEAPNQGALEQTLLTTGRLPSTSQLQINACYGYGGATNAAPGTGNTYLTGDRAWNQVSGVDGTPMPALVGESSYFGENNNGNLSPLRPAQRMYRYWALLSGLSAGYGYGDHQVSEGRSGWQSALTNAAAQDCAITNALMASIKWYLQIPSKTTTHNNCGRTLISAGQGTSGNDDWIQASIASDGTFLLAYCPTDDTTSTRGFSVDLRSMAGSCRGRWFNVTTGVYTNITAGYTWSNTTASQAVVTPGNNGTGQNDWLLFVDSTPQASDAVFASIDF